MGEILYSTLVATASVAVGVLGASCSVTTPAAPLPRPESAHVAAVEVGDGIDVFYAGGDGRLWWQREATAEGTASAREALADGVGNVVASGDGKGVDVIYALGADGALERRRRETLGGAWGNPQPIGACVGTGTLAVDRDAAGRLDLFCADAHDGGLVHTTETGGVFGKPERLAEAARDLVVSRKADALLDLVYVVPQSGEIRHLRQLANGGGWSEPEPVASGAGEGIAVARNTDGRLEVLHTSGTGRLADVWQNGARQWQPQHEFAVDGRALASATNADGRVQVFVADHDGNLSTTVQSAPNAAFGRPVPLGWQVRALAAVAATDGRLRVYYLGDGDVLYHDWQVDPGRHWAGEYPVPAQPRAMVSVEPLGAPALTPPNGDAWHVNDHTFARDPQGRWQFFGIVARNPPRPHPPPQGERPASFAHATSAELLSGWVVEETKPFVETLDKGGVMWAPHIVWDGSTYHAFYCTGGDRSAYAISHRTSPDLVFWSPSEVVFRDGWQGRDPMVLRLEDRKEWVMYYTATENPDGASHHVVAYRTSTDLVHWSDRAVAYRDFHVGTGFGPTESPFVVHRGAWYYLFIGPRPYDAPHPPDEPNWQHPGYVGTDVFRSSSFDRFTNADFVGHLPLHAAEVVQDDDGKWYASSAGIRQGGLYLTPLTWDDAR
jgi:arabinan endo-1,5-alpha-L-arabinosidase